MIGSASAARSAPVIAALQQARVAIAAGSGQTEQAGDGRRSRTSRHSLPDPGGGVGLNVGRAHRRHETPHLVAILDAGRHLDAASHIHTPGA